MPESKSRKKKSVSTVDPAFVARQAKAAAEADKPSPAWLIPTALTLMIVGLVWVVIFYLINRPGGLPIPGIGAWNLAIGFGLMITGFIFLTRWK